jgi:hypothetical protein
MKAKNESGFEMDDEKSTHELERARHVALILAAGEIAADIGGDQSEPRRICRHEAGHAAMTLALGDSAGRMQVYVGPVCGYVSYDVDDGAKAPVVAVGEEESTVRAELSDGEKLARLADMSGLDLGEIRSQAETILREYWIFVATVANSLEWQLAKAKEARISGNELDWMWGFYQLRKGK